MDVVTALAGAAAGLGVVFLLLCAVTVGLSVRKHRADAATERTRQAMREALLERQEAADPDWARWVDGLAEREREQLTALLTHYLRLVTGEQREAFREVAAALGLGERAVATLRDGSGPARLRALATLTLLEEPVPLELLEETCTDHQQVREAAARFLVERRDAFEDAAAVGTRFIVWAGREPATVYGMETLAALNTGEETPLLALAQAHSPAWTRTVLIQACQVIEAVEQVDPDAPFDWLVDLLEHAEPRVRAAAVRAFKHEGWRADVRDRVDVAALVAADAPAVRRATYEVLAYWGDEAARARLLGALRAEADPRAQLVILAGLAELADGALPAEPPEPGLPAAAWAWVRAERAITERPSAGADA